ncbi:hypothetical protein [Phytobacter massiliensis]|uniref:hypothetical protein n=1 Tax=Phytobacter massiliensis TaxID=1485952 RepID=UPI0011AE3383|nr:hypothetical protein [Phytobacter massiliensis]
MKRIIIGALIATTSSTALCSPENYTLNCETVKNKIMYFTGHKFSDMLVMSDNSKGIYAATFDVNDGGSTDYETFSPVVYDDKGKPDSSKVYSQGAVELIYTGEGLQKEIHIVDSKGNHPCKITKYDQDLVGGN